MHRLTPRKTGPRKTGPRKTGPRKTGNPNLILTATLTAYLCLLPSGLTPQDPAGSQDDPAIAKAVASFSKLNFRRKATILRTLQRQVDRSGNAAMQRIADLIIDEDLAAAKAAPVFDPKKYTPKVPLERVLIKKDSAKHKRTRKSFPVPVYLPHLNRAVAYDWCLGEIVRIKDSLSYEEVFENYLYGYAPGSDDALAQVLRSFDEISKIRKYADWFGHAYCDRTGGVYEGITLYQAWYSGKTVEVPDIDALPFAWHIQKKTRYRTPLNGRPRDRLYQAIRDSALKYRIHRSTCEAAAAAFIRAEPIMDGTYARLVPRFHFLLSKHDDDIEHIRNILRKSGRDKLIAKVDSLIKKVDGPAYQVRENRKQELAFMAESLHTAALKTLAKIAGH